MPFGGVLRHAPLLSFQSILPDFAREKKRNYFFTGRKTVFFADASASLPGVKYGPRELPLIRIRFGQKKSRKLFISSFSSAN